MRFPNCSIDVNCFVWLHYVRTVYSGRGVRQTAEGFNTGVSFFFNLGIAGVPAEIHSKMAGAHIIGCLQTVQLI